MPTPDTALRARQDIRSSRSLPRLNEAQLRQARILQQMDQGVGDTLRSFAHPIQTLRESVQGVKQFLSDPKGTAKALRQSLQNEESRNQLVGSMLVPDPMRLAKVLRTGKLPTVKSDIVVPETLSLPNERIALERTKRWGAPDYETGWFKGGDGLYRKEIGPVQFDISKIPEPGEFFRDDFFDHPDLLERLQSKGLFKEVPGFQMDEVGKDALVGKKFAAMSAADDNEIILGEAWRGMPEHLQKEVLTHELQHAIQKAGMVGRNHMGSSPGYGTSFRRYLLNPGEIEARAAAARDYLLDPRYRDVVPFQWNTKRMAERLRHGMNTPKMEGPKEFLEDMEAWLQIAEPAGSMK